MKTEADYYELFEAYQRGELPEPTRTELASRLAADPVLARRYADFDALTGALHTYGQRRLVRGKLTALQTEIDAEAAREETLETGVPTMPSLHISPVERRLREFWGGHRATIAVAASVAVLAVFATLLGIEWWRAVQKPNSYGYTVLRREMDRIKRNQRAINRTLNQIDGVKTPEELNPGKFGGTGFALTTDGYLITSYHVIQGADSLLIESRDRQRYRAEPVFSDVAHDLAILRINDKDFKGFGRLPYSFKRGSADLGERVYTLGYPREDVVFGEGSLSARSGFEGDTAFYQISIPVNPGNSGGPLLDDRGNLIGVISGRQMDVQSAAFATKSSYLMRLVDSLSAAAPGALANVPRTSQLTGSTRAQQVRKLQDFVFVVKVYE
ncbi:S1 family peptidase [Hymenobacter guriensis]|uniref:Trypsin-like peptidase domain-containing protein n=1 Tax=Hymenobacter guriensis TaxID=2793065 RepID=A0ABS0KZ29_9BACT|nr:serine protease [Hymenobacter guriensis]MBG8553096.1 trypsin-like peptidase domain-containing protein [Hymenobacter guriensis]